MCVWIPSIGPLVGGGLRTCWTNFTAQSTTPLYTFCEPCVIRRVLMTSKGHVSAPVMAPAPAPSTATSPVLRSRRTALLYASFSCGFAFADASARRASEGDPDQTKTGTPI